MEQTLFDDLVQSLKEAKDISKGKTKAKQYDADLRKDCAY